MTLLQAFIRAPMPREIEIEISDGVPGSRYTLPTLSSRTINFSRGSTSIPAPVDLRGQCRARAPHLVSPRAIVASGLYESPVRHAADSFRLTRFPNEARDYNKEANGGENVDETTRRSSRGIRCRLKKNRPRHPSRSLSSDERRGAKCSRVTSRNLAGEFPSQIVIDFFQSGSHSIERCCFHSFSNYVFSQAGRSKILLT